jgi:hypothetical protein
MDPTMSGKKQLRKSLLRKIDANKEFADQLDTDIRQSLLAVTKRKHMLAINGTREHLRKFCGKETQECLDYAKLRKETEEATEYRLKELHQIVDKDTAILKDDEEFHIKADYHKFWEFIQPILEKENETRMEALRMHFPQAFLNEDAWWNKSPCKKTKTSP